MGYNIWLISGIVAVVFGVVLYNVEDEKPVKRLPKRQRPGWSDDWVETEEYKQLKLDFPVKYESGEFEAVVMKDFDDYASWFEELNDFLLEVDERR